MMFNTLNYSLSNGVAEIQLNRPQRHNAVNAEMNLELSKMWQHFNADPKAVVAVLSGAGERAFCTGADIADLPQIDDSSSTKAESSLRWTPQQNDVWKPVICAVNGMTVGGGLHFLADSDIVLAAEHATFFDTHVRVGLVAGLEPVSLARRMPMEAVLRMSLMGGRERMSAARALELGLVGEVVAADQLLDRARELAQLIAKNSPSAMARTKRAIWAAKYKNLDDAIHYAWDLILENNTEADFHEGATAFLEGREPQWQAYHTEKQVSDER